MKPVPPSPGPPSPAPSSNTALLIVSAVSGSLVALLLVVIGRLLVTRGHARQALADIQPIYDNDEE